MSHHMHIPPNLLPMQPNLAQLDKTEKAKKKERLKKTTTAGKLDEDDDDEDGLFGVRRPPVQARDQSPDKRPGGKSPRQHLSDKVVKTLLDAQEEGNKE